MLTSLNYGVVLLHVTLLCSGYSASSTANNEKLICLAVEISGAVIEPRCNGHYQMDKSFATHCSGRQAWSRNEDPAKPQNGFFLYYLEDGYDGWVVAKTSCMSWGNFISMVKTDAQTPFQMTEVWTEFNVTIGKFVESVEMRVECVETIATPLVEASQKIRIVQKISVTLGAVLGGLAIVMLVRWILLRKRNQRREEESGNVAGEVKRNIYIGISSSQQYKLLEETGAPCDCSKHDDESSERLAHEKF